MVTEDKKQAALLWGAALCLILLIVVGNVLFLIFDLSFYKKEFARRDVYANFMNSSIPDDTAAQLVSYFASAGRELPSIALYGADERSHLLDVKLLIVKMQWLMYAALAVGIGCAAALVVRSRKRGKGWASKVLMRGGAGCIGLMAGIIVLGLKFEWLFTRFHHVFFPQGNWMFPVDSGLIRMFPELFFYDCFVTILVRVLVLGTIYLLMGLWLKRE